MILRSNWKLIAVGIAAASLITYITVLKVERDHYKKQYNVVSVKFDTLVAEGNAKEAKMKEDNSKITDKYKGALKDANTLVTENARLNAENIRNAKELHDVKLSLAAVRLFNASKQAAVSTQEPAPTVSGNDDAATATAKALEVKSQTLADLLAVVNENDANHLKCIQTVDQWQQFWTDYEQAYTEVYGAE